MTREVGAGVIVFGMTIDYQLRYHDGLYQRLADNGWEVHLIAGEGPIGTRLSEYPGITLHNIDMARNPAPLRDLRSLFQWIRTLRNIRPDIVVVGTPKAGLVGGAASATLRVRSRIYELHGLRLEGAKGLQRKLLWVMECLSTCVATQVIAVSGSLRERAISERFVSAEKVMVLRSGSPNGVDIERFEWARRDVEARARLRSALGIGADEQVVVFVGRLTQDKGLGALGEAMLMLEQRISVRLLVVGPEDGESGESSGSLISSLSKVTLTGEVDDVSPYLAIADVLCLPSRREGLSTVVLEAFASGVPVVATSVTGISDVVEDYVTGRAVSVDSPVELSQALFDVLSDSNLRVAIVARAGQLVRDQFGAVDVQQAWERHLCRA